MKINRTPQNPYCLSTKQQLALDIMVRNIIEGRGLNAMQAHKDVYSVKSNNSASVMASKNLRKPNFHQALLKKLESINIIGENSKIEERIVEGLDATDNDGNPDYKTRLGYIQEINKIVGVYR